MTTALFMGRFQPPHLGHILTIKNLSKKYSKLIIGVTEGQPSIISVDEVVAILRGVLEESNVEFLPIKGVVEEGTATIDIEFDVCCSGNPAVLNVMEKNGFRTQFVERSNDEIYTGSRIRQAFAENALSSGKNKGGEPITHFCIAPTSSLRPIEKINPIHLSGIETDILETGIMLKPLIIDRVTKAVLDGSHRYAFLVKHDYKMAPVLECDYDDESVFVGTHLGQRFQYDESNWISKEHVRAVAFSGKLYNPRTTRHFFPWRKVDLPTSLDKLGKGSREISIAHLFGELSPKEEVESNQLYISELEHEQKILQSYIKEQAEVLNWLKKQNTFIGDK